MSHNHNLPATLNAEQAAKLLGCNPRTLLRKCREGNGPPSRTLGRSPVFATGALLNWLASSDSTGYTVLDTHQ